MNLVPMVNSVAQSSDSLLVGTGILLIVLFLLFSQFGKRMAQLFTAAFFTNWRLALLGLTGFVLSVASGWTTWDGMSNFTQEPILSALVTFGIQGVMLIAAWLIGESFATGMNHRPHGRHAAHSQSPALRILQPIASSFAGILLFTAIGILVYGTFVEPEASTLTRADALPWWNSWWDKLAIAAPIVLLMTLLIVNAGSDVLDDYTQSLRVMIRSAVLWLMFLACMATSVFFSFDSLFSTIFPKDERARAAELRAQNQVAGIINDIASLAATRRISEQETLFTNEAWQRYSQNLDRLAKVASGAEDKLQGFLEQKMRERQAQMNRFQEDKASAESQQVGLSQRKTALNSEISRLKEQATRLEPEVARLKTMVFEKDREIIAKTAETEAEAGGIGVTSIVGRGPKYRELKAQLDRLLEEKKNLQLQLREFETRLETTRKRLAESETELSRIDSELAKLKGRSDTAERLLEAREKHIDSAPNFDASSGLQQLAKARETFRRQPTVEGLAGIQTLCGGIVGAMQSQDVLKDQVRGLHCDPGAASEAASRLFAINAGIVALKETCVGGSKLPATGGPDALFGFARRCVQDAGLPSRDTDALRQQINIIELNRDDKAHRFVVTANAFGDGNKLAYLALGIAIAIDSLVFMSGLFGANAVRSPLSDVPSHKGRSARQLEDVVENALLPDKFDNAMHALEAIQPVSGMVPIEYGPGWTHEAVVPENEIGSRLRVLKVLNAGATISAVRRDETYPARYFIRSELIEFLNQIAKKSFESDKDKVKLSELRKIVTVALQPYVSDHADIVLGHMHPISDKTGFTSEIYMTEVPADDVPIVQRSLNAGATLDYVQRDDRKEERDRFYVHKDFYRTLATLSAEHPKYGRRLTFGHAQLALPHAGPADGGALLGATPAPALASDTPTPATRQITSAVEASPAPQREDDAELKTPKRRHDDKADVRRRFLDPLIQALGIEPEAYFQLSGPALGPALATSEAFKEQRGQNRLLERNLKQRDRQAEQRIESAYKAMEAKLSGSDAAWQRQMLDDARNEIEQNWAILMMLPKGPYEILFGQMIENYEQDAADGLLTPDKEQMLRNVRAVRAAITSNSRSSASDWLQLEHELNHFADTNGDGEVVPFNSRRA